MSQFNYNVLIPRSLKKLAFTLAEVLIVIGIIGIVAVITLPNMITKIQDRVIIHKLRQAQTIFSNALELAQEEYGELQTWPATGDYKTQCELYYNYISKFLKVAEDCGYSVNFCGNLRYGKGISTEKKHSPIYVYSYTGTLLNGMQFAINAKNGENTKSYYNYGTVTVDVNGRSGPNVIGRDVFQFIIADPSVTWANNKKPHLYPDGQFYGYTTSYCLSGSYPHWCTYWALKHNNLDYLYCKDKLSENGPYSCGSAK